ncbi:hypothetical protein P0E55_00365 [Enterococcus faecalis]|uniref:DUF7448 domain-containing protein n=1 Tax=Enterococcus faecalis TaxID=1351 RepID=UPI001928C628|nr:hypothetical protein [Enterococcus faecalis]MDN3158150.1 hypothetical protein [Enterococcus faecalis]MDN3178163.1 hypothetical protein [Enterococcus faecalis]HCT7965487.1 hypothetical protein [Enterococcus faecalis]
MCYYDINYGEYDHFKELLINKRIVEWNEDSLILEDGTEITIECSEQDCCAGAYGKFKNVKLDAMITDVSLPEITNIPDEDTIVNQAKVTIFHNQNPIAIADFYANAGNGGYYYSVASFVIKDIHYKVVEA